MPAVLCCACCRDIEDKPRFLVGVQVDVTDHPTTAEATPVGMQAASVVGAALQNMNWCALAGSLARCPCCSNACTACPAPSTGRQPACLNSVNGGAGC